MKKLILIIGILIGLTIGVSSQNDYRDTVIESLINKKINEYRVENGLYELIPTERFRTEVSEYAVLAARKIEFTSVLEHSGSGRSEIICYTPSSDYWADTKEDAYKTLMSADSIAEATMDAWKNSPPHNYAILDGWSAKQIITEALVFYIDERRGWATFIVTQMPTESKPGWVVKDYSGLGILENK
jgi:hypothetical protein